MVGCFDLLRNKHFRVINRRIKFQTIQLSMSIIFVYKQLNVKTILFQTVWFSISKQFCCIWLINRTLSDAATPSQNWPWSDGNEGVLGIPQSSSIIGTSPSDCFVSYARNSLGGVLPLCREAIGVLYSPSQLGKNTLETIVGRLKFTK